MVFNSTGCNSNEMFVYNDNLLETVSLYTYLGINMACSGSFSHAVIDLRDKSLGALFQVKNV